MFFLKSYENISCPKFQDTDVTAEALSLREDETDNGEFRDLFTVCYYHTRERFNGTCIYFV